MGAWGWGFWAMGAGGGVSEPWGPGGVVHS